MSTQVHAMMRSGAASPQVLAYDRFAAACSILTGCAALLYGIAFLVLRNSLLSGLALMLSGLFLAPVLIGLRSRLQAVDGQFAALAVLLAGGGVVGSLVHGGYDLAAAINPPATNPVSMANLPNAVDPRGLLTFGVAGLGILLIAWLMQRSRQFPTALPVLGYAFGLLLVGLYLARLIILDAAHPLIAVPALVTGFVVGPLWNIWIGVVLARPRAIDAAMARSE